MSYDLYILSQQRPSEEQVRRFISQYPGASIEGTLAEQHNLVVDARASLGWALTIDPPSEFYPEEAPFDPEDEDLRERLTPSPVWETFISVPYGTVEGGVQVALNLAQELARKNNGKTWNPQTDELT
jgi:hypothetical protein